MRVLVCGGRHLEPDEVCSWLRRNAAPILAERSYDLNALDCHYIIHGGATGADDGARLWAYAEGYDVEVFRADWKRYGRGAGPIRNAKMLREGEPDIVIALPGGRGTADMVRQAKAAGVPVVEVERI